jgi:hypothetical protein
MSKHRTRKNTENPEKQTTKNIFGRKKVDMEPDPPNINQVEAFAKTHLLIPGFLSSEMPSLYYNHPFWPSPRAVRIARMLFDRRPWYLQPVAKKPEGRLTHDKALAVMADVLRMTVHQFLHVKPIDAILRLGIAWNEDQARKLLGDNGINYWWILGGTHLLPCCACDRILAPPEPATVVPVRDPPTGPLPPLSPAPSAAAPTSAYDRLQQRLAALSPGPVPATATVAVAVPASDEPREARQHPPATAPGASSEPREARQHPPAAGAELTESLMEFLKEMNGSVTPADQRYLKAILSLYKGRVL